MVHQPKALSVLFFTELWERFSFYGMKALLIFYLTKYYLFSDNFAAEIIGNYAALVYAIPIIGGYIADKYIGHIQAVIIGAIFLTIGHLGMAIEGTPAYTENASIVRDNNGVQLFFLSMSFIIAGVGLLKANISTLVGALYNKDDGRRDSGFTLFYMGINLGSAMATFICGYIGETYGWSYGFGLAGLGMISGLITFLIGKNRLVQGIVINKELESQKFSTKTIITIIGSLFSVIIFWILVQNHKIVGQLLVLSLLSFIAFTLYYIVKLATTLERGKIFVLLILTLSSIVFWSIFEQEFISMNLFADRLVDREIFGATIKASTLLTLNPIFIILLAPIIATLWNTLALRNADPSPTIKFAFGLIFAGLASALLVAGCYFMNEEMKVHLIWLILAYLFLTIGEICLSPVGLSAVTKLSPTRITGVMMGGWFLATAGSEYLAAVFSKIASVDNLVDSNNYTLLANQYKYLFSILASMGILTGIILLLMNPLLSKIMNDKKIN